MKIDIKDKNIAILGYGIEGKDALVYLLKKGTNITVLDKKNENDLNFGNLDKSKFKIICGKSYLKDGLTSYNLVFRSPGVYRYLPEIVAAEKKGVEISSSTKLFFDLCPAKIIGVTGTKGKGTTSTLIYEILKKEGRDVYLAGNIGKPVMEILPSLNKNSWVVLELSSFQLIDLTKSPYVAVILNITVDHLDWHKDRDEYVNSKIQIVKFQDKESFAVINHDYSSSKNFSKYTKAKVYFFSKTNKVDGCYVKNGKIFLEGIENDTKVEIGEVNKLLLKGVHNWENITAAICASKISGASINSIKSIVFSFKGLAHRLELVRNYKGIKFYNDSFSTNPQTTIAAVNSFSEPLTLILGGFDKGLSYDEMSKVISKKENVNNIVLIGNIAGKIESSLFKAKYKGNIIKMGKQGMKDIVKNCRQNTPNNGVVLLSPGSSSFDMFSDYKERGNVFKSEVRNLNG